MSADEKLIDAMADYLREKGWSPVVGGPIVIQQQPGAPKFNYELVIGFTAAPPDAPQPPDNPKAESNG
jgi:hypothetical protein